MNTREAIEARHSVRSYTDEPLSRAAIDAINRELASCNRAGGLHLQLVVDEPEAFTEGRARYGQFHGVHNYIAVVGKSSPHLQERCGYYGERAVLAAQRMGLNTCWVGFSFKRVPTAFEVAADEKLVAVIAIGYGETQGKPHKIKSASEVSNCTDTSPDWFKAGVAAALLAPTAVNQQRFTLTRTGNRVAAKAGIGFFTKLDLGIVKYHFEAGAGKENFRWTDRIQPEEPGYTIVDA